MTRSALFAAGLVVDQKWVADNGGTAELDAQKAIEARRKRARAYMARMQGQPVPDDLLEPAATPAEDFDPAKPVRVVGDAWAAASGETDLGSLELRPGLK